LLKREQLRKKARRQGAVQQPEVSAGELVDGSPPTLPAPPNASDAVVVGLLQLVLEIFLG